MNNLHKPNKYSHHSVYPEVRVNSKNLYYAEILMDDYAGLVSEVTAINQYLFHHVMFEEVSEDLAELLEGISITEMHHMEMLAETIRKLGGIPMLRGSYSTWNQFWNGSFVYYGNHICDRLLADIGAEKQAIATYKKHIEIIDDQYIKAMLQRIILDEQIHLELFNDALEKYQCKY